MWDPLLQILLERGVAHEQSYVEHLTKAGLDPVRIDGIDVTATAAAESRSAMQRGAPVIVQAALRIRVGMGGPISCVALRPVPGWRPRT